MSTVLKSTYLRRLFEKFIYICLVMFSRLYNRVADLNQMTKMNTHIAICDQKVFSISFVSNT